jgi:Lrp/AsnC family transcriptional regulator, leucine-responsive regulatory protein
MSIDLDTTDWAIIRELQRDARQSFNQIAKRVSLSAPSVAVRVRRLEDAGVIEGYHARINAESVGLPLTAFLQLHCRNGRCLLQNAASKTFPEIVEIHRLSGGACSMVKVRAASMAHLSSLLERIGVYAETDAHIVLETPFQNLSMEPPPPPPPPTHHDGWQP